MRIALLVLSLAASLSWGAARLRVQHNAPKQDLSVPGKPADIRFFQATEDYIYMVLGSSDSWRLARYRIGPDRPELNAVYELKETPSAWGAEEKKGRPRFDKQ